ncbi:MAG: histidine phosphatase family protein [Nanoarchaeota archaeon]|nr:histidine phosphatase family protein [Nanoarchaeota archaeon]
MKYKIYVFRHGQTYFNKNEIFTGWKDSRLTPLGIRQAKHLGKLLENKKIGLAIAISLSRSKDTLKYVLKYHPECKRVITDDRIIERNYGKLNGKKHSAIIKKYGQWKFDLWHRGFDIKPPGGESFADVEIRVKEFIKALKVLIKKEKCNIAISASGNSIRLFKKIMEKSSKSEAVKWIVPYDDYLEYVIRA